LGGNSIRQTHRDSPDCSRVSVDAQHATVGRRPGQQGFGVAATTNSAIDHPSAGTDSESVERLGQKHRRMAGSGRVCSNGQAISHILKT
jgi:hypothetical protein